MGTEEVLLPPAFKINSQACSMYPTDIILNKYYGMDSLDLTKDPVVSAAWKRFDASFCRPYASKNTMVILDIIVSFS
jgi:hypothetical protein